LDTLIEEESENGLAINSFTKSEIRLDELTLKSLIDQAKNEGILIEPETNDLNEGKILNIFNLKN
jgi:hypothetical protein